MPESPTRQRIRSMTLAGMKPRAIAAALSISVQRVYELLKKMGIEPARDEEASA